MGKYLKKKTPHKNIPIRPNCPRKTEAFNRMTFVRDSEMWPLSETGKKTFFFDDLSKTAEQKGRVGRHKSSPPFHVWCVCPWLPSNSPLHLQSALPNIQPGTAPRAPAKLVLSRGVRGRSIQNAPGLGGELSAGRNKKKQQYRGRNALKMSAEWG